MGSLQHKIKIRKVKERLGLFARLGWALLPHLLLPDISYVISDVFLMARPNKRQDPLSLSDTVVSGVRQVTFKHVTYTLVQSWVSLSPFQLDFAHHLSEGTLVLAQTMLQVVLPTLSAPTAQV